MNKALLDLRGVLWKSRAAGDWNCDDFANCLRPEVTAKGRRRMNAIVSDAFEMRGDEFEDGKGREEGERTDSREQIMVDAQAVGVVVVA